MERTDLEQWKAREVARLLALVETERRYYQEIVASVPVGLLVFAHDLSVVSSNREVRKIFGLRSGDPVRGKLDTLLPAEVFEKVREVLNTGNPQNNVLVQTEGEAARHLRISIQSIRNWDDETEQEALVTVEDVSALPSSMPAPSIPASQAGALHTTALPASELLENLDAIVWAVELPSMQFLYVNEKSRELLGYPAEKWLNSPEFWKERIHPDDRDWVLKSYDRAIETWSRHSCEYRAQTSTGQVIWMRETARVLVDERSQSRHLIGIAVEVTQRRLLEEQAIRSQRADAVGKLGNRVGHEIHNLLMVVSGYGEELIQGLPTSHPLHSDLQEILSATDRLRGLANQLSLYSRRPPSQTAPVDLSSFITRLQPNLKTALGDAIRLDVKMFPATIGVQADPAQLEQLVMALAQRARRQMSDGGTLTIECSPLEITEDLRRDQAGLHPGVYAVISVEDSGTTPHPEALAALFESFGPTADPSSHKPDSPSHKKNEGEGKDSAALLSRMYGFVRQWGGDVWVSANSPQGTVIQVFLPRVGELIKTGAATDDAAARERSADEQHPGAEPAPEPVPEPTPIVVEPEPVRETILIAEEDAGIRALVKKILKRQNYIVLEAGSAEEALKAAGENAGKLNLLIADVTATQFDGGRLAQSIITQFPETRVLYLSGYTDDPSTHAADVPEGAAFLQKPFTLGSLLNKVKELLEAKPE